MPKYIEKYIFFPVNYYLRLLTLAYFFMCCKFYNGGKYRTTFPARWHIIRFLRY